MDAGVWSLRKMGSLSPIFPESIDEVLTAVQETPRGRWFLEAYANRVKNDGTANILSAIAKLENNLNAMTTSGAEAGLLQQARNAIAAAKREIALLEPQTSQLSAEGQMFVKLAELSRQAFATTPASTSVSSGVDRVFKLVAELDKNLAPASIAVAPAMPAVQYFKQDEAVFEPAPAPVMAVVAKPTPAAIEVSNRGAKLTIQRISPPKTEIATETVPPEVPAALPIHEEPVAIVSSAPTEQTQDEPSRIVIIRRKADELIDVPLLDEQELHHETETAA